MNLSCPWFHLERWDNGSASWRGPVKPSGMSESYDIRILYEMGNSPKVTVVTPELHERADGQAIPHVYTGKRLCLYLPNSGEWSPRKLISETIVPWTSLWLFYYEIWHATGTWAGGGVHPTPKQEPSMKPA